MPSYRVGSHYQPAHHVGGDYLGVFPLPSSEDRTDEAPRRWAFVVADVSGKGMTAALYAARLSAEVRVALHTAEGPLDALEMIAKALRTWGRTHLYVTLALAVLDRVEHRLTCVSAGHWPPLVRRANGGVFSVETEASGLPVPWFAKEEARHVAIDLAPGDAVVLFTDGVIDAVGADSERYGPNRLRQVVEETQGDAHALLNGVLSDLGRHVRHHPQFDDIAVLSISREDDHHRHPTIREGGQA